MKEKINILKDKKGSNENLFKNTDIAKLTSGMVNVAIGTQALKVISTYT